MTSPTTPAPGTATTPGGVPLSVLDLAPVDADGHVGRSIEGSVALAQAAERLGYRRVWYAEHHSMPSIASSATSVLIAHVAARTSTIRLGAGGVMLPNHSPLVIAEQFGTLASIHPGRIDLGLGRAPGSDRATMHALRRDASSSDAFPRDVQELQGYLAGRSLVPGVQAVPGAGTHVPLYVLGSSLFGAHLAAALGLPYAFASHFAPQALEAAVRIYRHEFTPSEQLDRPHVVAGVNVLAADSREEAEEHRAVIRRSRAVALFGRGRPMTDAEADLLLEAGAGAQVDAMLTHTAAGTAEDVAEQLDAFARLADADELITAHSAPTPQARVRSLEIAASAPAAVPA